MLRPDEKMAPQKNVALRSTKINAALAAPRSTKDPYVLIKERKKERYRKRRGFCLARLRGEGGLYRDSGVLFRASRAVICKDRHDSLEIWHLPACAAHLPLL